MKKLLFVLFLTSFTYLPAKKCLISIGPQGAYTRVKESNFNAGPEEKLTGGMGGIRALFEYKKFRALYTAIYSSWLYGKPNNSSLSRRINTVDGEGRFGYNFQAIQSRSLVVTPYLGFGMYYSSERRNPGFALQNTTAQSYYYYTYYIPVGLILDMNVREWFHWLFHFQWRPDIDPTVKTKTIAGVRYVDGKKENQFFIEMPFSFRLGCKRRWDISLTPFWKLTKHGSSLISPSIRYIFWGGSLDIGYHF